MRHLTTFMGNSRGSGIRISSEKSTNIWVICKNIMYFFLLQQTM